MFTYKINTVFLWSCLLKEIGFLIDRILGRSGWKGLVDTQLSLLINSNFFV